MMMLMIILMITMMAVAVMKEGARLNLSLPSESFDPSSDTTEHLSHLLLGPEERNDDDVDDRCGNANVVVLDEGKPANRAHHVLIGGSKVKVWLGGDRSSSKENQDNLEDWRTRHCAGTSGVVPILVRALTESD